MRLVMAPEVDAVEPLDAPDQLHGPEVVVRPGRSARHCR